MSEAFISGAMPPVGVATAKVRGSVNDEGTKNEKLPFQAIPPRPVGSY